MSQAMDVPILLYHSITRTQNKKYSRWAVSPELFKVHLGYLKRNGYTPMTISDLVSRRLDLPKRPIAITFDDAMDDFREGALPILQSFGYPATMYVPTGYVGKISNWLVPLGEGGRQIMSWSGLREVADQGIELGSHSHKHIEMDTLPALEVEAEVCTSKDLLEQNLGRPVLSFAYPHGYHSKTVVRIVQKSGFTSACAVKHSLASLPDGAFSLGRIIISPEVDERTFGRLIQGIGLRPYGPGERLETIVWRWVRTYYARLRGADHQSDPGAGSKQVGLLK